MDPRAAGLQILLSIPFSSSTSMPTEMTVLCARGPPYVSRPHHGCDEGLQPAPLRRYAAHASAWRANVAPCDAGHSPRRTHRVRQTWRPPVSEQSRQQRQRVSADNWWCVWERGGRREVRRREGGLGGRFRVVGEEILSSILDLEFFYVPPRTANC